MTNDEQIIKAALDMAAMAAVTTPESRPGAPREWSDGFTSGCLHSADAIRAIDPADVLAKVEVKTPHAWQDVMDERGRQMAVEGWTPEHDGR